MTIIDKEELIRDFNSAINLSFDEVQDRDSILERFKCDEYFVEAIFEVLNHFNDNIEFSLDVFGTESPIDTLIDNRNNSLVLFMLLRLEALSEKYPSGNIEDFDDLSILFYKLVKKLFVGCMKENIISPQFGVKCKIKT